MEKLIEFLISHQALLASIPGAVSSLIEFIEGIVNRGGSDTEKQAKLDQLAIEIRALAEDYRRNPPELPE